MELLAPRRQSLSLFRLELLDYSLIFWKVGVFTYYLQSIEHITGTICEYIGYTQNFIFIFLFIYYKENTLLSLLPHLLSDIVSNGDFSWNETLEAGGSTTFGKGNNLIPISFCAPILILARWFLRIEGH